MKLPYSCRLSSQKVFRSYFELVPLGFEIVITFIPLKYSHLYPLASKDKGTIFIH